MRALVVILFSFVVAIVACRAASASDRVALVIGNSAYKNAPYLPNPVNDAADVSASLGRLGFSVTTLTNANYDEMRRALIKFGQQALGAELAVVFFAGHGIQMAGENWLIPTDAQLATDLDVTNEDIGLQAVTRAVSNTKKLGLVILDACRTNPFLPKMQSTNVQRSVDRGFSRIEPTDDNILVAYAARDGTTASDGSGRNSPFTRSLLSNMEKPGLEINDLFRSVRSEVMADTHRQQQPFVYGSLSTEKIYLKSLPSNVVVETPAPAPDVCSSAEDHWRSTTAIGTLAAFQDHLSRFPNCKYAGLARAKIETLKTPALPASIQQPSSQAKLPKEPSPMPPGPPKQTSAASPIPAAHPKAVAPPKTNRCFMFNGEQVCE